jgi:RHS repeat-associated protein
VGETVGTAATRYFLKDSLGSVIAVINGSGSSVRDRYAYGPYGAMTVVSGTDYEPIRYAGGYFDTTSGLVKFGARYYDSNTGRWTQMDPIGGSIANPATLNGYIYAGDDPINNVDPTGRDFTSGCVTSVEESAGIEIATSVVTGQPEVSGVELGVSCLVGGIASSIGGALGGAIGSENLGADIGSALSDIF